MFTASQPRKRVIIIGGGVAGTEAGTYIGQKAQEPIEVIQIEAAPERMSGGWAFQSFPSGEKTNLAMRKMYLGDNPSEILAWAQDPQNRQSWPEAFRTITLDPNRPFPRCLMKEYVKWRRANVQNANVTYRNVIGEAVKVTPQDDGTVEVRLEGGRAIEGDQLIMASGSISVKVPDYLKPIAGNDKVIIDPLTPEGHDRRAQIPTQAKVLVLGTGLTGEEQANILLKSGHSHITMVSRGGLRHYAYAEDQISRPLVIEKPDFITSPPPTPEAFVEQAITFFGERLSEGYTPEDIHAALRPYWEEMRHILGRCEKAAEVLYNYRRPLAVYSIGASHEVSQSLGKAEEEVKLTVTQGYIKAIKESNGQLEVDFAQTKDGPVTTTERYDYIINAVGRNILRHPIWDHALKDGIAKKHAGIGVMVNEHGQMLNAQKQAAPNMWVIGMPRAGDHTLRHGYLGNFAFNVPQIREHCYKTVDKVLEVLKEMKPPEREGAALRR